MLSNSNSKGELVNVTSNINDKLTIDEKWKLYVENAQKEAENNINSSLKDKAVNEELNQNSFLRNLVSKHDDHKIEFLKYQECFSNLKDNFPDDFLFIFIIRDFNIHTFAVSDYFINHLYLEKISKISTKLASHEKIEVIKYYFYLGYIEKALEFCESEFENEKTNLNLLIWKGCLQLIMYFQEVLIDRRKILLKSLEKDFLKILKFDKKSIVSLYCLEIISLEITSNFSEFKINSMNQSELYAVEISKLDKYMGYIAWIDIYLYSDNKEKIENCPHLLNQIITLDYSRPEAYIKLLKVYFKNKQYDLAYEIGSKLFIYSTFGQNNLLKYAILKYYTKTIYYNKQTIISLELLQNQYITNSHMSTILLYYAQLIIKANYIQYYGSGLSALEECLLVCIPERRGKIYFYMGKIYIARNEIITAMKWLRKCTGIKSKNKLNFIHEQEAKFLKEYNMSATLQTQIEASHNVIKTAPLTPEKIDDFTIKLRYLMNIDPFMSNYYDALIHFYIMNKRDEGILILQKMIQNNQTKIQAHIELWKMFKIMNDLESMIFICEQMINSCNSPYIPGSQWIEAHIIYAKTLAFKNNFNKSISVLQSLCSILPKVPILVDENYIYDPTINYNIRLSLINSFNMNENNLLVGKTNSKNQLINSNEDRKENPFQNVDKSKINSNENELGTERLSLLNTIKTTSKFKEKSNEIKYSLISNSENRRGTIKKLENVNQLLNMIEKPEKSENQFCEIDSDSAYFLVTTNPKFLYTLGKIIIQSNMDIRLGIQSLSDYIFILKNFISLNEEFKLERIKKELKAKYWICIGLFFSGNFTNCQYLLEKIIPQIQEQKFEILLVKAKELLYEKVKPKIPKVKRF